MDDTQKRNVVCSASILLFPHICVFLENSHLWWNSDTVSRYIFVNNNITFSFLCSLLAYLVQWIILVSPPVTSLYTWTRSAQFELGLLQGLHSHSTYKPAYTTKLPGKMFKIVRVILWWLRYFTFRNTYRGVTG